MSGQTKPTVEISAAVELRADDIAAEVQQVPSGQQGPSGQHDGIASPTSEQHGSSGQQGSSGQHEGVD